MSDEQKLKDAVAEIRLRNKALDDKITEIADRSQKARRESEAKSTSPH